MLKLIAQTRTMIRLHFRPGQAGSQSVTVQFSHWFTVGTMLIALIIFMISPYLALTWVRLPFPGFVVEQTGVVANVDAIGWSGRSAGINYPQKVIAVGNTRTITSSEYMAAISQLKVGQIVTIRTRLPDGAVLSYDNIEITAYPPRDFIKFFLLPYLIGLSYLAIGAVIYWLRGHTQAGRSFAFFCAAASITISLTFDISTTHISAILWTLTNAMLGGAIAGLSILFPTELAPLRFRTWIRFIFYIVSIVLMTWGWRVLYDQGDPWAYIRAWRYSYFYSGIGLVCYFGTLVYRLMNKPSAVIRQQIRIILFGSMIAFVAITIWFGAPILNISMAWNPVFFYPTMMLFPVSVGIAILRYRLWDIDIIIHRTLVYAILTGLLGGIYYASVVLLTQFFGGMNEQASPSALVVSTLVIASLFTPLRRWVQNWLDRRFFRKKYNAEKALATFTQATRDEVEPDNLVANLVSIVDETMQPRSVHLWLRRAANHSASNSQETRR